MALSAHYSTGTATVAAGAAAVTGVGTSWQTASILPDDEFVGADGRSARILTVNSNTSITLAANWPGAAQTGGSYYIRRALDGLRMQEAVLELLQLLKDGTLTGLAAAGSEAGKAIRWTGPGAAELFDVSDLAKTLLAATTVGAQQIALGLNTFGIGTNVAASVPSNDANSIVNFGVYVGQGSVVANLPNTSSNTFALMHLPGSTSNIAGQFCGNLSGGNGLVYWRRKAVGAWGAWSQFTFAP